MTSRDRHPRAGTPGPAARPRSRRVLTRVVAVAFGLLIALAGVEVVLQGMAHLASWRGQPDPLTALSDLHRIVVLGDSNSYGLFLQASEAYPAVVARKLAQDPSREPTEIVNLAFPGTPSSVILERLPAILRATEPDEVWLMVGANDFWTAAPWGGPEPTGPGQRSGVHAWLWARSRLYRLLVFTWRACEAPVLESPGFPARGTERAFLDFQGPPAPGEGRGTSVANGTFVIGGERIPLGPAAADPDTAPGGLGAIQLIDDRVGAIARLVHAAGARLMLITYPHPRGVYGMASARLREAAEANGLELVDAGARFAALCPKDPCPSLFFDDHHPKAAAHEIIASLILERPRWQPRPASSSRP